MDTDFTFHLEELRRRLLVCIGVFGAAAAAAYFFSGPLLEFLTLPLRRYDNVQLFFHRPYEAFLTHLKVAALTALVVSSPVLLTQAWLFVRPGLYDNEKRAMAPLILVSIVLFLAGVMFAYAVVVPWGLHFLLSFQSESLKPLLGIGPYFSFLIGMILAFGALFEFPVVIVGLVKLGTVTTPQLASLRKVIVVLIFVAAALLTPSPDPVSQLLLAVPLMALFEISLIVARWVEKKPKVESLD